MPSMKPSLLKYLLIKADYELTEAGMAAMMFLFGIQAFVNRTPEAWARPAYKYMKLIFTPDTFMWTLLIFGALGLFTLWQGNLRARLYVVSAKTLIWLIMFIGFAIVHPLSPTTVSPFIGAIVLWHFVLIGRIWSDISLNKPSWKQR